MRGVQPANTFLICDGPALFIEPNVS